MLVLSTVKNRLGLIRNCQLFIVWAINPSIGIMGALMATLGLVGYFFIKSKPEVE